MAPKNTRSTIINKASGKDGKINDDSCVVPGCTAISDRSKIVLFNMAFGDLVYWWRSTSWVNKFQTELPENARICEVHFEERFIDRTRKKPRLFPGTVPTLQLGVLEYRQGVDEERDDFESKEYFCRFCAKKEDKPMTYQLSQMTNMQGVVDCCLGQFRHQADLPNGVCQNCMGSMRQFEQFVRKCDAAQKQLLKIETEIQATTTTADKENTAKNTEPEFESVDLSMDTEEAILSQDIVEHEKLAKIEKVKQRCLRCDKDFTNLTQYRNHMKSGHRDEGYECQICNKKFSERSRLRTHLEKVHENRRYKCPECPRWFNWQCSLATHMKIHEYKFSCDDCWRTFPTDEKLQDHRLSHDESKHHKCLDCGHKFKTIWRMEAHKERVHKAKLNVKKYQKAAPSKEEKVVTMKEEEFVISAAPIEERIVTMKGEVKVSVAPVATEDTNQIDLVEEMSVQID